MDLPVELFEYVNATDRTYRWQRESAGSEACPGVSRYDLSLTSQTWMGHSWRHHLSVFVPPGIAQDATHCLLIVGADGPCSHANALAAALMALCACAIVAYVFDVPNQPLYDGLVEDALIARTFVNYLDTGEPFWPLLLPMTKAASAAMDALQSFAESCRLPVPASFVVSGASKRGWTTWLTAVVDSRVAAIAPEVYDNLNIPAQMKHQLEVFETYSEEINDYSESGLIARMASEQGQHLARIVDPYTYLEKISCPVMVINATNDPYWASDALCLYWDALTQPKSVVYAPNQGHCILDPARRENALVELLTRTAKGSTMPVVEAETYETALFTMLNVRCSEPVAEAVCWVGASGNRDFRKSLRLAQHMPLNGDDPCFLIQPDSVSNQLLIPEIQFHGERSRFWLSAPPKLVPRQS